jgi:hypothetical protein
MALTVRQHREFGCGVLQRYDGATDQAELDDLTGKQHVEEPVGDDAGAIAPRQRREMVAAGGRVPTAGGR